MKKIFERKKNIVSILVGIILILTLIILLLNYIQEQAIKDYQRRLKAAPVGAFIRTEDMNFPRAGHSAIKLNDGRVLIVGGNKGAELFDSKTGKFRLINKKLKYYYTTIANSLILKNGDVLVAGTYIFSPQSLKFKKIDDNDSFYLNSVLLPDGNVFIIKSGKSYFIYNPKSNKLERVNKKLPEIFNEQSVLKMVALDNGKIFVAGAAFSDKMAINSEFTQFYLWDYKNDKFTDLGKHELSVEFFTLDLFDKNKVFIIGGGEKAKPLIYDANTNKFTEIAQPKFIRAYNPKALTLKSGNILLIGGEYKPANSNGYNLYDDMFIEIYDTKANKFFLKSKTLRRSCPNHYDASAFAITELEDGNILISGGDTQISSAAAMRSCLIYKLGDKTNK